METRNVESSSTQDRRSVRLANVERVYEHRAGENGVRVEARDIRHKSLNSIRASISNVRKKLDRFAEFRAPLPDLDESVRFYFITIVNLGKTHCDYYCRCILDLSW